MHRSTDSLGAPLSLLITSVIVAIIKIPKKKTSSPYVKEKRKAGTRAGLTKAAIGCTTPLARSLATAKPMPAPPPEGEKTAVLMPTTSPWALKVGLPELPWFTGASICRKSS